MTAVEPRTLAPPERRTVEVVGCESLGAYAVLWAVDRDGPRDPQPGQFYMLSAAEGWGGGASERPYLPRAFSFARALQEGDGIRLAFLLEEVGPGTERLARLEPGDGLSLVGPLGIGFRPARDGRRPLLVGGGIGTAPLLCLSDGLDKPAVMLGFRSAPHAAAAALFTEETQLATDDGSAGRHGLVTELLAAELDSDAHAEVFACGPPAMLEAVRALCAEREVPAQLAMESGMACGFGACFGCVVPTREGYVRLCVDGPVLDASGLETASCSWWRASGMSRQSPVASRQGSGWDLCGVPLSGPVLNGSGTFDAIAARRAFGDALLERFPFDAFVSKTITREPRQGNPPPRLWETPAGLINSIGLPNKGLDGFLAHDLPELAELPVPLVVSVMAYTPGDLAELAGAVAERDEVAMVELNVSCPNVESGLVMGADPSETARAVEAVRSRAEKPVIVKLTPNATDPAAVAAAAEGAGADAVSLLNTLKGMALDPRTRLPWLGGGSGGLSGPAVRAVALEQVAAVSARVGIPVVGMGGIATGADAADFLAAGARVVAVGTESFRDPAAGLRIRRELPPLQGHGPPETGEAVGAVAPEQS